MFRLASPRIVLFVAAALLSAHAFAARVFPQNTFQVKVHAVSDDTLVANKHSLHLAPGVLIFSPSNSTIVKGEMPVGVYARVQLDLNGDVRRIWLLTPDEVIYTPWWNFWSSDDIKEQPNSVVPTDQ